LLGDWEAEGADADVVIGGKESDHDEDQAAACLKGTKLIEAGPGALWCCGAGKSGGVAGGTGGVRQQRAKGLPLSVPPRAPPSCGHASCPPPPKAFPMQLTYPDPNQPDKAILNVGFRVVCLPPGPFP
jgi:hypothetical protein